MAIVKSLDILLRGRTDKLKKDLQKGETHVKSFGERIGTIGKTLLAGGALLAAGKVISNFVGRAVSGMQRLMQSVIDTSRHLTQLSVKTGVSVQNLSRLKFAGETLGIAFEDIQGLIEEFNIRLGETIQDGVGPMSDAFKVLGLDAKEIAALPIPQAIGKIGDALNRLPKAQRGFLADEIFGGDAFKALALLRQGQSGLERIINRGEKLGLFFSASEIKQVNEAAQSFREFNQIVTIFKQRLAVAFAPVLERITNLLSRVAPILQAINNAVSAGLGLLDKWVKKWQMAADALVIAAKASGILEMVFGKKFMDAMRVMEAFLGAKPRGWNDAGQDDVGGAWAGPAGGAGRGGAERGTAAFASSAALETLFRNPVQKTAEEQLKELRQINRRLGRVVDDPQKMMQVNYRIAGGI
jgi:DNA-binding Xre family transcriptional regulator